MQPLPSVSPSEAQVRTQLVAFLRGSRTRAATLALFDRADFKAKLPDPTLRAALVALGGTVAEPVITFFLRSTTFAVPRFGGVRIGSPASTSGLATSRRVVFSRRYAGEHFALLSAVFAHEILHHDAAGGATEEVILHALTAAVHMQVLIGHPELATAGTELGRVKNDIVLLFVNSRAPGSPKSAIIVPAGKGTAPGSSKSQRDLYGHAKDFGQGGAAAGPTDNTPAPPAFASFLRKILAPGVALPKPLTYSKKSALLFSKMNDTWLSPVDRLRVSVLLGLVSMEEITAYTGLSRTKAIKTFKLAPILAAMR